MQQFGPRNRSLREKAHDALYRDETGTSKSCRDCSVRFAAKPWYRVRTVGHNVPLSRVVQGETRDLVKYDQCAGCNADQGTRTPEEWRAGQASGAAELIRELTDEQKRIKARVTWERQYRRKNPGKRIDSGAIPHHLRSHEEFRRNALSSAKHEVDGAPREIGKLEAEVASAEKTLASVTARPTHTKRLFGLLSTLDRRRVEAIAYYEDKLENARGRLATSRAMLVAAQDTLRSFEAGEGLRDCPCVACMQNFDDEADWRREQNAKERRDRWRGRQPMPYPSRGRYRRRY